LKRRIEEKVNGHKPNGVNGNGRHHEPSKHKLTVYELSETPFFWRFWTVTFFVVGLPWFLFMAYLLFQTDDQARATMSYFNKGKKPVDQNYALDCGFESFYGKVFDVFTLSHGLGWFVTAFAYRSFAYTLLFSLIDELCEVWWRCSYPNFQECWWDHIFLDFIFTNAVGAYLGAVIVDKWLHRPYSWWRAMQDDKRGRKYVWTTCVWAKVLSLLAMFGFKWVLWIPSNHWINVIHLFSHGAVFFPVIAEGYGNLTHGTRNWRWSFIMWICYGVDAAVCIKMGYATPLFQQWDIWGKLLAGALGVITVPAFTMYLQ